MSNFENSKVGDVVSDQSKEYQEFMEVRKVLRSIDLDGIQEAKAIREQVDGISSILPQVELKA